MRINTAACLAMLVVGMTGCSSSQVATRGQSVQQTGHHQVNTVPNHGGHVDSIQNYFHDQHGFGSYSGSYHSTTGYPGYSGFAGQGCPSGACRSGACPPGGCPSGHCGSGHGCPHHHHSYSYQRPQNLVYPDENAVGGSVVYPYYTHKGPSDFFMDDGSVLKK